MARTRYHGGFSLPANLRFKPSAKKPQAVETVKTTAAPANFPRGIVSFSSGAERCGVNEYSVGLARQLRISGQAVTELRLAQTEVLAAAGSGSEVLLHVEPSLLVNGFDEAARRAQARGAKVVSCCHYFDRAVFERCAGFSDVVVAHRDYGIRHPKLVEIPLGCPVYSPVSREALRGRFDFRTRVVTTLGFLSPWKKIPDLVELLLPRVVERGARLQVLCPTHFSGDKTHEDSRLRRAIQGHPSVIWMVDFLPEQEVLERVAASTLGALYHGNDTGSVSAANNMFVSARCPLVLTSSNHDASVVHGAERLAGFDLLAYVDKVVEVLDDEPTLHRLRSGMEIDYQRLNQAAVAQRYVELFREIKK